MGILKNNLVSLPKFREIKHIILQKKFCPQQLLLTQTQNYTQTTQTLQETLDSGIFSANVI